MEWSASRFELLWENLTFSLALPRDQSGHFELSISLNSCILIFCSNYSHNYASYLIDLIFRFYSNLLLSNHALNHRVLVVSNAFHLIRLLACLRIFHDYPTIISFQNLVSWAKLIFPTVYFLKTSLRVLVLQLMAGINRRKIMENGKRLWDRVS